MFSVVVSIHLIFVIVVSVSARSTGEDDKGPTPFTLCKSYFHACDGVYDATGRCVCGSEVRTLRYRTFKDEKCKDLQESLPQLPIATDVCFHFNDNLSIKVSCIKGDKIGAKINFWDGLSCESEPVAETTVYPNTCVFGGLETYVRGVDTWVNDDTCSDEAIAKNGPILKRPTIAEAAIATDSLSTLVAAVKAAGLVDTLNGEGSFTVFAPNNEAFAKVPKSSLNNLLKPENVDQLRRVLLRHVLPTINWAGGILKGNNKVKTVGGEMINVIKSKKGVSIESSAGRANVIAADIRTANGVVHIVDTVF